VILSAAPHSIPLRLEAGLWDTGILDPEADEVMLDLMRRDTGGGGWWLDERELAEMAERRRNAEAYALIQARKLEAIERHRVAREEARARWAKAQAERMVHERNEIARIAARDAARDAANRAAFFQAEREEWVGLLIQMRGVLKRVPRYHCLLPTVERDLELIRDCPPGRLPWRLCRATFAETWRRYKQEATDAANG